MPFYEYHCANCGHHHEELQKVGDKPLRKCPACGRNRLSRLISAPVFRLKGGGWYETDFKSEKEARRNIAGEKEPAEAKPAQPEKPAEVAGKAEKAPAKPEKAPGNAEAKDSGRTVVPVRKPAARAARPKVPKRKGRAAAGRGK
jgi:putative FmdB family regulatory protein